jgi:hypothetical protein
MATEFFNFELTEFQVLDDFEFDETVQREEKVRFYTLEEQTVDAFEKMMPKGRVTEFQRQVLEKEVDRLRDLYTTYVTPTAETYAIREPGYAKNIPWVYPVYGSTEYIPYSVQESWAPLYEDANLRLRNFYPRMLAALPRPFPAGESKVDRPTEYLNPDGQLPRRALPPADLVRTSYHDDGTLDIMVTPVDSTADTVQQIGYYIAKRPLDIPNPLEGHPFFKANEPTFIESTQSKQDVLPSIDAILEHGVPVTNDPYKVAEPYLKLYDIRLTDIPWALWRTKFPSVEPLEVVPPVVEIPLKSQPTDSPNAKLAEEYGNPYAPGMSARYWLMHQLDGGELVLRILLSHAIDNGSVEAIPGVDIPVPEYPKTTPEECLLLGKSFEAFQVAGLLRQTPKGNVCVPTEFLLRERKMLGYRNRKAWKETTADDIVKSYAKVLSMVRMPKTPIPKFAMEAMTPAREDSVYRREVLAVLDDPQRTPADKVRDVQELLRPLSSTNKIYLDPTANVLVFCGHTMAVLEGKLNQDRKKFHEEWTTREAGYRYCKFCGEQVVMDDFVDQDDFNEDGFALKHSEEIAEPGFHASVKRVGMESLRMLFNMESPADATTYLVLSLLQVLPSVEVLEPLLTVSRARAGVISASKIGEDQKKRALGALGIGVAALVLQTHIPTLVPRRSFGPKPLMLSGYPRDEKTPGEFTIVDTLMMVLRRTFEAYPSSFSGPSVPALRAIANTPGEYKKGIYAMLDLLLKNNPSIRAELDKAKAHVASLPPVEQPKTLLPVMPAPTKFGEIRSYPDCSSGRAFWTSKHPPQQKQPEVPLRAGIQAAPARTEVEPPSITRVKTVVPTKQEVVALYKKGIPAAYKKFLKLTDDWRTNVLLASRLGNLFDIETRAESVDPAMNKDLLRDYALGIVYEVLHAIQAKNGNLEERMRTDLSLYTLTANVQTERQAMNTLRARERATFTTRMRLMSDKEREITGELLRLGLAPYVIRNEDRRMMAQQAEEARAEEMLRMEDDADIGRAPTGDIEEQDFLNEVLDSGDAGDHPVLPVDRDYESRTMYDT